VPIKAILARLDSKAQVQPLLPEARHAFAQFAKSRLVGCVEIVMRAEDSLRRDRRGDGSPLRIEPPTYHRGDDRNGTERFLSLRTPRIVPSNGGLRLDGTPFSASAIPLSL
jgi:hypothetical protein